jgi:hypothetical protein
MQITEITVSYGQTQSLPEYSNVKPMVTLKATVTPDENIEEVRRTLFIVARSMVESEIDDALERHGRPAVYDPAPRYQVQRSAPNPYDDRGRKKPPLPPTIAIVPDGAELPHGDWYGAMYASHSSGLRLAHAQLVAEREVKRHGDGAAIVDCSDGDLSRLPARPALAYEGSEQEAMDQARATEDERRYQEADDFEDDRFDEDEE